MLALVSIPVVRLGFMKWEQGKNVSKMVGHVPTGLSWGCLDGFEKFLQIRGLLHVLLVLFRAFAGQGKFGTCVPNSGSFSTSF